jgi:hypothetical protein
MRGGHLDAVSRTQVSGWAANSEFPDRRLELRVLVNGVERGRTVAGRPRADLANLGKYGDGKHGFAFAFPEPLPADQDNTISVHFAADMGLLPNGERVIPRDPSFVAAAPSAGAANAGDDAGPDPILVTAPGRSGTTYLMNCLAAAPQIVVAELVPYEVRLLSYYAAAFAVLTAPADTERSTHPDKLEGDGFHIGFNPFNGPQYAHAFRGRAALDYFNQNWVPQHLGAALAGTVREYYQRLAVDRGKGSVAYFAEKNNNLHRPTRMFVRRVFPRMREIVIVRDPRDVLCSHMAYFDSSQDKAFHQLSHSCRQLATIHGNAGPELCVIRYEDMIAGDPATFSRVSGFLDATVAPVETEAGGEMFRKHGTSDTPAASIGRWRHDLPAEMRARSSQDWGEFLDRFGYPRT